MFGPLLTTDGKQSLMRMHIILPLLPYVAPLCSSQQRFTSSTLTRIAATSGDSPGSMPPEAQTHVCQQQAPMCNIVDCPVGLHFSDWLVHRSHLQPMAVCSLQLSGVWVAIPCGICQALPWVSSLRAANTPFRGWNTHMPTLGLKPSGGAGSSCICCCAGSVTGSCCLLQEC